MEEIKSLIAEMLQASSDSNTITIFRMMSAMIDKILKVEVDASPDGSIKRKLTPEECLQTLSQCLTISADHIQEELDKKLKKEQGV